MEKKGLRSYRNVYKKSGIIKKLSEMKTQNKKKNEIH